jgi:hypothetical protein
MGKHKSNQLVPEDDPNFARFWAAYPKRVAKLDARKAWAQVAPEAETVDRMIEALEWQARQPAWTKDGGEFVPYPARWLRAQRWTDEPPQARRSETRAWICPHLEHCAHQAMCESKRLLGTAKYPVRELTS